MSEKKNSIPPDYDPELWKVEVCGLPGQRYDHCFSETTELLELCGQALYGNGLFDVMLLRVCHRSLYEHGSLGYEYDPIEGVKVEWIMKTLDAKGNVSCRFFESRHEAFAMLIAEMKLGAVLIELWNKDNCCPREEGQS